MAIIEQLVTSMVTAPRFLAESLQSPYGAFATSMAHARLLISDLYDASTLELEGSHGSLSPSQASFTMCGSCGVIELDTAGGLGVRTTRHCKNLTSVSDN